MTFRPIACSLIAVCEQYQQLQLHGFDLFLLSRAEVKKIERPSLGRIREEQREEQLQPWFDSTWQKAREYAMVACREQKNDCTHAA